MSEFWAAFSTLDKAVEALINVPKDLIIKYRLEIYEVPVDATVNQQKKRLDANDPRIAEAAKQVADRRRNST